MHGTRCPARIALACALVGAVLAGCASLAPPDEVPTLALTDQWKSEAPAGWVDAGARQDWQSGRWWAMFGDAQLDALVPGVEAGNQNIALAVASVAQAQALLTQARAQLAPTVGAQLGTQRSGSSAGGSASLGLNASWAPDLWQRLGDAARAQQASLQASEADLAGARLAAQASLAQAYFSLREADAEIGLMDEIIVGYERAATITGNRYAAGIAAHTDLLQAQSQLAGARSTRASLARSRATYEHAIALLLGRPPAAFALPAAPWVARVPAVPPGVPSELLLRRPDVAAAERTVAAANARIGVARAAWFPSFTLSASVGGGASDLARLVSAPTLAWSLGAALAQTLLDAGARDAALAQTLLDAGARDAALAQAVAAHEGASASYRQTALTAMGQVEDQLTALAALATQIDHQKAAAEAAAGAEQRIMNSYQAGISAYTDVVSAQASALSARRTLMQLQLQRQQAAVALVQALGGGWHAAGADSAGADTAASPG
ncbi:MAG: efflux transporter outer membrane subunit [Comamonadaceae bacterium]|nr:efflux transporter outer membrane subunit [Burkholderiales bacterium]MEB2348063.1 efflux transporter outer membrane subunit [Comamonadaceae bacterium]